MICIVRFQWYGRRGVGYRTRSSAQVPLSKPNLSEEINVLFDSGAGKDPENLAGRLHVLGDESLQDVKLKLKLRGWFTSNQTLVSLLSLVLSEQTTLFIVGAYS